jgi:hypothetical protein
MATVKQIEANRRNALKSTGPRTPEGRAAIRLNAVRQLRGSSTLRDRLHQICAELDAVTQLRTRDVKLLIDRMAVAQWNLRTVQLCEALLFPKDDGVHDNFVLLDRFYVYKTRFESEFWEAHRALENLLREQRRQFRTGTQPLRSGPPANAAD